MWQGKDLKSSEVWQGKELLVGYSDLWQGKDLVTGGEQDELRALRG